MSETGMIGRTLGGFRIEQRLGAGGMGAVYSATQLRLGRRVALKVLAPNLAVDQEFAARFLQEGRTIAALDHPNIVPIYEAGEALLDNGIGPFSYLAMRYISGGSLRDLIARQGRIPLDRALALMEQAAAGLDAAHRYGIIHRDVKPGNLLLEPADDGSPGERLFIADFGIAKSQLAEGYKTQTGAFLGTPEYMAPEQFQSAALDRRVDVYALAVVLYEMLTGQAPFRAETPVMVMYRKLNEPAPLLDARSLGLPAALDTVLARGMAARPDQRYASTTEFAAALRTALSARPLPTAASAPTIRAETPRVEAPRVERRPPPAPPVTSERNVMRPTAPPRSYAREREIEDPTGLPRRGWMTLLLLAVFGTAAILLLALLFLSLGSLSSSRNESAAREPAAQVAAPPTEAPTEAPSVEAPTEAPPAEAPTEAPTAEAPTAVVEPPTPTPLPFPEQQVTARLNQAGGTFGALVYDEKSAAQIYDQNADRPFPAASLIKLPIALTVYHLAQQGQLSLDEQLTLQQEDVTSGTGTLRNEPVGTSYTLRDLCIRMLRESDNTAGNMILKRIEFKAVNDLMRQLGARQTQVQRRFLDNDARQSGRDNLTSPQDMLLLLRTLDEGSLTGKEGAQELLAAMNDNTDRQRLPAQLPPEVVVAHKTGTLPPLAGNDAVEHDAGIITLADRRYIVVLMSNGLADNKAGIAAIADTSKLIFDYMSGLQS